MLHWAASYGDSGSPTYAAIWLPDTDASLWNNDGIADTAAQYQGRFDAETSAWCRPSFVTLNGGNLYFSASRPRDRSVRGPAQLTRPTTRTNSTRRRARGSFRPSSRRRERTPVGAVRGAVRPERDRVPRKFTATGPVANAGIDAMIEKAMQKSPVKHAALAIVHGTKLVYARG